eukprot:scaffold7364_cov130-Isochrysis_galbana.AAC.4
MEHAKRTGAVEQRERHTVDSDGSRARLVPPLEEANDGRLARAGWAAQCHHAARLDGERDAIEHPRLRPGGVGEADVVQLEPADEAGGGLAAGERPGGARVQQVEDPLRGAQRVHERAKQVGQPAQAGGDGQRVKQERGQRTEAHLASEHEGATVPQNADDGELADGADEGAKQTVRECLGLAKAVGLVDAARVPIRLARLHREGTDGAHTGEGWAGGRGGG